MATLGTPAHWTTPLQPLSSEWTTPLQPLSAENPFGLLKLQLGGWLQEREPPLRAGSPGFNSCIKRNRNSSGEKVRLRSTTPGERMVGPAPGLTLRARAQDSPSIRGMSTSGALRPPHGCHDSGVAGRLPTLRADLPSPRTPRSAATMSQGTADLASETVRRPGAAGGEAHGGSQLPQAYCYRTRASSGRRPPPCPRPSCSGPRSRGHCFQEAPGTAPSRTRYGSEVAADW